MESTRACGGENQFPACADADKLMLMEAEANNLRRQVQILTATVALLQECIEKTLGFPVINSSSIYYKVLNGASLELDNIKSSLGLPIPVETNMEGSCGRSNPIRTDTTNTQRQKVETESAFGSHTVNIESTDAHPQQNETEMVEAFDQDILGGRGIGLEGDGGIQDARHISETRGGLLFNEDELAEAMAEPPLEVRDFKNAQSPSAAATFSNCPGLGTSTSSNEGNRAKLVSREAEVGKSISPSSIPRSENQSGLSLIKVHDPPSSLKKHKCSYCNASFKSDDKERHERRHTGEKPYACTFCPASFTEKGALKRHERTHTGEKPYKCTHCPASFSESSQKSNEET